MPFAKHSRWREFLITADNTDLLNGDPLLGAQGKGWYRVTARAAAAADATISIDDHNGTILDTVPIPVRAAAVTYPEVKENEDASWTFYTANDQHPKISILDGTNAEITVRVRFLGKNQGAF